MEEKQSNSDVSSLTKEVGRGSFFFGIAGSLEQILAFLLSFIVVRVLSEADYGFYGQINSYYSIALSVSLMASFRNIIIKYIGNNIGNREKINQVISTHFVYAIFSTLCIMGFFLITYSFNIIFETRFLLPLLIISTNSLLSLTEISILFVGLRQFKTFNIWKIFFVLAHFLSTLGFLLIFQYFSSIPGYYGIFWGITFFAVIMIILLLIFIHKNYGDFWNPNLMIKTIIFESLIYGVICIISGLVFNLDVLLLADFINNPIIADPITAHFLNIQKTGINFSRIISILIGSMLTAVLTPLIQNKDFNRAEKLIGKIDKILFYILSLLMIVVAIAPEEILFVLYGSNYVIDSPYLYSSFFIAYYSVITLSIDSTFIITNKLNYLFLIEVIKTFILISLAYPLMIIFTPFIGMLMDLALSLTASMIIKMIISSKVLSISYWKYIKKIIYLGSLMIFSAVFLEYMLEINIFIKIGLITIFLIVYNILIIITGIINREDIQLFKSLFQNEKFGRLITPIIKILDKIPFKEK